MSILLNFLCVRSKALRGSSSVGFHLAIFAIVAFLSGCGAAYRSPGIDAGNSDGVSVEVVGLSAETIALANKSPYQPRPFPVSFLQDNQHETLPPQTGSVISFDSLIDGNIFEQLPKNPPSDRYRLGVGDVVRLRFAEDAAISDATRTGREGGLLTVQDDGSIALPQLGRTRVVGMTLPDAENALVQALIDRRLDAAISLEVIEFKAHKVSISGAVKAPINIALTMSPLTLQEALVHAGGIEVAEVGQFEIRVLRDGTTYRVSAQDLQTMPQIRLRSGDQVQVVPQDSGLNFPFDPDELVEWRRLDLLHHRENREQFETRLALNAVPRDYVYLTGEIGRQHRYDLPFERSASLADALFDGGRGLPTETADVSQIYILRKDDVRVTAWHLDIRNAANLTLATQFELRPNDVIFIAEQPITRWGRVVRQISPSLITTPYRNLVE